LLDTAWFTITITDANGCTYTRKDWIFAEDVRCFAGNSNIAKLTLCHQTGSTKNPCVTICVDQAAVQEHLAHGDFLGSCTKDCKPPSSASTQQSPVVIGTLAPQGTLFQVKVINNPSFGGSEFRLNITSGTNEDVKIIVTNMYGQKVYTTKGAINNTYRFGANWTSGTYIIQVIQGKEIRTLKVIKGEG
jgi:hypothetical protein